MISTIDRCGFTVIEILVALTVFSLGILSLTVASSLVTRMVGEGHQYSEASAVANQHFEWMRTQGCSMPSSGSSTVGDFSLTWQADSTGSRTPGRRVSVTVVFPTASGGRTTTFSSVVSCRV